MLRLFVFVGLGCIIGAPPVIAQHLEPVALAAQDRAFVGPRVVLVAVPKAEIEPEIDLGRVISDAAYGGGLLGALINESKDHKREDLARIAMATANADAAPLRKALGDFDLTALAAQSARSALSQLSWFQVQDIKTAASDTAADPAALAKAAGTPQFAILTYRYRLSADCTQIKVIADVVLYHSEPSHGHETAKLPQIRFQERFAAIAQLRKRSYEHAENVAQWSDDNARLAKATIQGALARIEHAIPYALNQSQADFDSLQKAKSDKIFAAGFYGPAIKLPSALPGETVLWQHGLIDVVDVPETAVSSAQR